MKNGGTIAEVIRTLYFSDEFLTFFNTLPKEVQNKYKYTMDVVQTIYVLSEKFVKKLQGSRFYEMRVSVGSNAYRTIIFSMNSDNLMTATEIYLLNSFLKKSEKDYKKQIIIADKILKKLEL